MPLHYNLVFQHPTLNPEFDLACDIPLECPPNNTMYIRVFDYDRLKSNDPLGHREEDRSYLYKHTSDPETSQVELAWKYLAGVDHGEILISKNWQPVKGFKRVPKLRI